MQKRFKDTAKIMVAGLLRSIKPGPRGQVRDSRLSHQNYRFIT